MPELADRTLVNETVVDAPSAALRSDGNLAGEVKERADILFHEQQLRIYKRADRWFAYLMIAQWLAGIATAIFISPRAWAGTEYSVHPHVWVAVLLGGAISSLPIYLGLKHPGKVITRHTIAIGQMLTSALLIHLTGGRIETHFHVFGSLALLSFYRDWRVLMTASIIVGADHMLRGYFFPQSVYGVQTIEPFRWLEHAGWVAFEDAFLIKASIESIKEMRNIAERQAQLELTNEIVEATVRERTAELQKRAEELEDLNARLLESEHELARSNKELEEFAYVASHDLQEPLRKIISFADRLQTLVEASLTDESRDYLKRMQDAAQRMRAMIEALLNLSRVGRRERNFSQVDLRQLTEDVVLDLNPGSCGARIEVSELPTIYGDPVELRQLFVNLLGNALKFRQEGVEPVIQVFAEEPLERGRSNDRIYQICVQDNGIGFDDEHNEIIFTIFQKLHGRGKYEGSGIGLAICRKIAQSYGGNITAKSVPSGGAKFIISLPSINKGELGDK
jgi:signal transduction histidine kinase